VANSLYADATNVTFRSGSIKLDLKKLKIPWQARNLFRKMANLC